MPTLPPESRGFTKSGKTPASAGFRVSSGAVKRCHAGVGTPTAAMRSFMSILSQPMA
jgi:hypothetical protein